MKKILVIANYNPNSETHLATANALNHTISYIGEELQVQWIPSERLVQDSIWGVDGVWLCTGLYGDIDKTLTLIKHARENFIPVFGTCGGFQQMILEYARNVMTILDAGHEEYHPESDVKVITRLTCSLAGREAEIQLTHGSFTQSVYGADKVVEKYYCNYGINPDLISDLVSAGLRIGASDADGVLRAIELPNHPFYIGTLFVPQMRSRIKEPHPLVLRFLRAVGKNGDRV